MIFVRDLAKLANQVRYYILKMTTEAGSGHPTSSLSAVELMVALYFSKLRYDLKNPQNVENDRVIFSKGHASPLFYALYKAAGVLTEKEILSYRQFKSKLEGHPRPNFPYAEAATGSLGQGLSVGVGVAMAAKLDKLSYFTYVLLGDSEVAEGSIWEACEVAAHYKLDNLVAILDVNRLGQSGETMLAWDTGSYAKRFGAFGWEIHVVNGHDLEAISLTYERIVQGGQRPHIIIAKTIKGKGVPFLEDKEGWHGKALAPEQLTDALFALGQVDKHKVGKIQVPVRFNRTAPKITPKIKVELDYKIGDEIANRKAYGETLSKIADYDLRIVSLDAETKNSTYAEDFKDKHLEKYFEMFIAEQNMVGAALGLARRGKIPFVSTFAVFFTRAFDQIRMSAYSEGNIKFVGSHGGVSIGEDGPSQMGLEDISMFKVILGSRVFVPSDAVSCARLIEIAAKEKGIFYVRTARPATKVLYSNGEEFKIGGSKILRLSSNDRATIIACGVTVYEALKAHDVLKKKNIDVRVIDAYSVKPIDAEIIIESLKETGNIITVEDHYFEGGLGDSVLNVVGNSGLEARVYKLAVSKMPMSGKSAELLGYEGIDSVSIVKKVLEIL